MNLYSINYGNDHMRLFRKNIIYELKLWFVSNEF